LPKLIARVKDWAPGIYLVGFKLLSGADEATLIETARKAGTENRSDLTVANDMATLRQGRHTIHLVRDVDPTETYSESPADKLVERVLTWLEERRA
jgi:phosphopantothenate-cysteine ligase